MASNIIKTPYKTVDGRLLNIHGCHICDLDSRNLQPEALFFGTMASVYNPYTTAMPINIGTARKRIAILLRLHSTRVVARTVITLSWTFELSFILVLSY